MSLYEILFSGAPRMICVAAGRTRELRIGERRVFGDVNEGS